MIPYYMISMVVNGSTYLSVYNGIAIAAVYYEPIAMIVMACSR